MHVIAVLNTKGGVGKTTLASCLAVRASADGMTAIGDLDPQQSLRDWFDRRPPNDRLMLIEGERASDIVESAPARLDYLILDGPPGSLVITEDAIEAATLVVIPIRASSIDIVASEDAIESCREAGKPCLAVINAKGQHDGKLVDETRKFLRSRKTPVAETVIAHRTQFINAMTRGGTGPEKDRKAAEEIEGLWHEVKAALRKLARARA